MKQAIKKLTERFKQDQEVAARKTVLEELFNDFHRDRAEIYKMNFVRGLTFGLGSVLGGTVVIALLIWLLSLLGNVIQPLGEFFDTISAILENASK